MSIYLPIAELPLDMFILLGLGAIGGVLAGMFGIGGGFLLTPLLIFLGVPPSVAVASSTNQIIASSVSGFLAHWRRQNVDIQMGVALLSGGLVGATVGIWIFSLLQAIGQIDLVISLTYVVFLGSIGLIMGRESLKSLGKTSDNPHDAPKPRRVMRWLRRMKLPFVVHFKKSNLKVSLILPILVGVMAGMLVSLMGIGGGFIMIPAMIYILGMPTSVVVGTSLFQIIFTTSLVTILHAVNTQSVDIVLSLFLILGGVIGAQYGTKLGLKLPADKLRGLLALIILAVCTKLGMDLFLKPDDIYSVELLLR